MLEIAKLFANSPEPLKIVLNANENLVLFQSEDTLVASRIIDGTYPDYKKIVPEATTISAEFSAEELLEAVKLINVFATEASSAIKIKLNADGSILLTSQAQEIGEHESHIDAQIEGDALEISFNSKYLFKFISAFNCFYCIIILFNL